MAATFPVVKPYPIDDGQSAVVETGLLDWVIVDAQLQ